MNLQAPWYRIPWRTVSQLKKRLFWVMPTGGMPKNISTKWNSVTRLFSKMSARREKCHSFDAIASPRPVVFPISWKVVFFELWWCSSRGAICRKFLDDLRNYKLFKPRGVQQLEIIVPQLHVYALIFERLTRFYCSTIVCLFSRLDWLGHRGAIL